jgi:hypothetical protein
MANQELGHSVQITAIYSTFDLHVENVITSEELMCHGIISFGQFIGSQQQNKVKLNLPEVEAKTKKKVYTTQGKYLGEFLIDDLSNGLYIIQHQERSELKLISR